MTVIVGAGLAGLLAAHAWPNFEVLEASPVPRASHKALLRFRTDAVSKLTGIEFRKVRVRKNLWSEGGFVEPNIALANQYSLKVLGRIVGDRSIWDLAPVERFIAPETLYEQLVDAVGSRITWGSEVNLAGSKDGPVISTIPLPIALDQLGIVAPFTFDRAPIKVQRYRLKNTDVYQTCYYPDPDIGLYRASITGDLLIAEFAAATVRTMDVTRISSRTQELQIVRMPVEDLSDTGVRNLISKSFGIHIEGAESLGEVEQRYGKISPIPEETRKRLLFQLTHDHDVYSLGRFAVWRNILLDDVVDDISVVRRLMRSSSYDMRRQIG